jgi:hypothetical protein
MHFTLTWIARLSVLSGATPTGDGQQKEQGRSVEKTYVGERESIGDADTERIGIKGKKNARNDREDSANQT